MKIICAWCKKTLGEKEPFDSDEETHTICGPCQEKQIEELAKIRPPRKENPCTTGVDGEVRPHIIDEIADLRLRKRRRKKKVSKRKRR